MQKNPVNISIIIPAKNEEYFIRKTLQAVVDAYVFFREGLAPLPSPELEVIVVDNHSEDRTPEYVREYEEKHGFTYLLAPRLGAAPARNAGAEAFQGNLLIFIDADTLIPKEAIAHLWKLFKEQAYTVGIFGFKPLEGGFRGKLWWFFWNQVRRLPLARAKAFPAFMFCERETFFRLGPFDEEVQIAEEWPITAQSFRHNRANFIYDRSLAAYSSNRRMELQKMGYIKTFLKYVWVVLHKKGRVHFTHQIRN